MYSVKSLLIFHTDRNKQDTHANQLLRKLLTMTVFWNYKKSKKETCQPLKLWYLCTHYYNTPLPSFLTFSDTRAVRDLPCAFTGVDHTAYWPKTQKSHISLQQTLVCISFLNTWNKTYLIILLLIEISSWNDFLQPRPSFQYSVKSQWISLNMTWSCTNGLLWNA